MRGVEAQRVSKYLTINGGKETDLEHAEIIAFFTCSIISNTEEATLDYLKKFIPLNKRIIILGCSPGMISDKIQEVFRGEMLATKDLERIDEFFPDFKIKFDETGLPTECHFNFPYGPVYLADFIKYLPLSNRIRKLKPQLIVTSKGCNNACNYCSVRRALGPLKNYRWDEILERYKNAVKKGHKVFVFNGDDTGAFLSDDKKTFADLLFALDSISGNRKIRWIIDNFHPQWFLKYFDCIEKLSQKNRIVEIIVPLQSASDNMLLSMRRKHTVAEVQEKMQHIKKSAPELAIRTHFIIGYPGETEQDITLIKQLTDKNYFSHIVLLRYFESGGPSSEKLQPKIPHDIIEKRIIDLRDYIQNKKIKCELTG